MRPLLIVPLFVLATLAPAPAEAHPLDGARVDLCASGRAVAGEPHAFFGRITLADRPDADHVGKLGVTAGVAILLDGEPVATGRVWYDGWYWGFLHFDAPGTYTLQAAWNLGTPTPVRSRPVQVEVAEGPATTGLTADLVCHLVYREPGFVRVWSVVTGTAPSPQDAQWAPVSGSVYVARPDSCWQSPFCSFIIDEQIAGLAGPAWAPWDGSARTAYAAAAGPFTYQDRGSALPSCSTAWWSRAWVYMDAGGETLRAVADDHYTGDEAPRVCG